MNAHEFAALGWTGGHNRKPGHAAWFKMRRARFWRRMMRRWLRKVKEE